MNPKKFDPRKLQRLNNPGRLIDIPPDSIQSKLTCKKPEILVEIGAGTAFFSIAFFKQFKPSKIYACDLSQTMIDWMQETVAPVHPGILPVKNEEESIPLDDEIADLVFMIALHHELEHPLRMLQEAYRIVKPGGEIVIVDWKKTDMPEGPPLGIRCLPETVKGQLMESGFAGVHIFKDMQKHFLVVGKKRRLSSISRGEIYR